MNRSPCPVVAVVPRWYGGFFYCPMCNWLEDAINFLFPEPVEVDMSGIEVDSSIAEFCREVDGQVSIAPTPPDAALPEPPDFFKAEPAVREAGRIVQGRSIAHFIADDRTVR